MAKKDIITKIELLFLVIIAIFILYFRSLSYNMPLDSNEGSFAYTASRLIQGDVPYKDVFEYRPPVVLYIYKTAFKLFGESVTSIRYFASLYVIVTCLLIYIIARTLWRSAFAAMAASLAYTISQHSLVLSGLTANAELWVQLPLLLSIFFVLDRDRKYEAVNFTVAGFFAAAAIFTSTLSIFYLLIPAIYILIHLPDKKIRNIGWYFAGVVGLTVAIFGWAAYNKIIYDMYEGVFKYNLHYFNLLSNSVHGVKAANILKAFLWINTVPIIAIIYGIGRLFFRPKDGNNFMLTLSVLSMALIIYLSKNSSAHYYMIIIPFSSLLFAGMINDINKIFSYDNEARQYLWLINTSLIIVVIAIYAVSNNIGLFLAKDKFTQDIYYEEDELISVVNSNSQGIDKNKDFIFVWANLPGAYFLSHAKAGTKYCDIQPLDYFTMNKTTVTDLLFNNKPVWLLLEKNSFERFQAYIDNYYGKIKETQSLVLYRNLTK